MINSDHLGEVELIGRVLEYSASALMEDFADGAYRSHDATTIELFEPTSMSGTRLTIYHDKPMSEHSPWRRVGGVLRFRIEEELLGEDMQIFSGAAHDLTVIPGDML
jgi:hypothetical protein